MTSKPTLSRADLVRQRRATQQTKTPVAPHRTSQPVRQTYHSDAIYLPLELRKMARQAPSRMATKPGRKNYDIAFNLGRTAVRAPAPALRIPKLGTRWISAGLTLLLGFLLYTMWTSSIFTVKAASVHGNQRLAETDVNAMLGLIGEPIFKAIPAHIETTLRSAFPDLASVRVSIGFPNHINVSVVEREPVLAWYQDGALTWIDANGIAFKPRGEVQGLVQVSATDAPPKIEQAEGVNLYEQVFLDPAMISAIVALNPYVPDGVTMVYDPKYGLGWQDPRGWSVYFGQNTQNIAMKLEVYQTLVDNIISQGIQPTLISMAYPDAPFYK